MDRTGNSKTAALGALALLLLTLGCATAGVENLERHLAESEVELPSTILVYDFEVSSPKDVVVDQTGREFMTGTGDPDERAEFGRKVASALSAAIVAEHLERGFPAEQASPELEPPLNALLLKGQFVTVDEGDQMARVTIGFGAGKSGVHAMAQLYQQQASGLRRISEGELVASGNRMPGMAAPVGAGAAAGRMLTSAAISGGLATLREIGGPLAGDLERIAEELADRTEAFYERRGWR